MIPFSMIDNVDTTLTPYARKFPALHSKEIFYDDEKRRYSIGDRTRRDVDVRYTWPNQFKLVFELTFIILSFGIIRNKITNVKSPHI
jgi:hypothetical protein